MTYSAFLKGLGTKRQSGCWSGFQPGAVGHCIKQLCVCVCMCYTTVQNPYCSVPQDLVLWQECQRSQTCQPSVVSATTGGKH